MRRLFRIVAKLLLWACLSVVALVAVVLIGLQWKPVRGFARDQALAALRGSLQGELFVDDVRWPSFERIELSGLTLRDRHHVRVAAISSLQLDLRLQALRSGKLQVRRLEADHVYVDLADLGASSGLLSVFTSSGPDTPSDPAADLSPLAVAIEELCITEGELRLQPDRERRLALRHVQGCVQLGVGRDLTVALPGLRAELWNGDARVLTLQPRAALAPLPAAGSEVGSMETGRPMQAALRGKLRFRTERDLAFDVLLPVRGFSAATLSALGVSASFLRGHLDADLQAHAKAGHIDYEVALRGPGSAASLSGQWTAEKVLWAHIASEQLEPAKLTSFELEPLSGELDLRLDAANLASLELQVNLARGSYGQFVLPQTLVIATRLHDGTLELRSFDAHYRDAQLSGHGRIGAAELSLKAQLDAADLASLQPLQALQLKAAGAISARLSLTRQHGHLEAEARLDWHQARYLDNRAEHVHLDLHAAGTPQRPKLRAHLDVENLVAAGELVPSAALDLEGGPERYQLRGHADTHQLAFDAWLAAKSPGWEGGLMLDAAFFEQPLHAAIGLARFVPEQRVELHDVRVDYAGAKLVADGQLGLGERSSALRVGLRIPDLSLVSRQFAHTELPGRVDAQATLRGPLDRPQVELLLSLANGPAFGGKPSRGELRVTADAKQGRARAELSAYAGEAHAQLQWRGAWKRSLPLAAAGAEMEHDLSLRLAGVSLGALAAARADVTLPLDGVISGQLHAHGNREQLALQSEWKSRLHPATDPTSFDALLRANYQAHRLELEAQAGDRRGQMFAAKLVHEIALEGLFEHTPALNELVEGMRWQVTAELQPRALRELPFVSGLRIDRAFAPLSAALRLELEHEPGSEPHGQLETKLTWRPEHPVVHGVTGCAERATAELTLAARLAHGALDVELHGGTQSSNTLKLQTGLRVPLAEVLAGQIRDVLGAKRLALQLRELDLAGVPLACEHASGVVSTTLSAEHLWEKTAKVSFEAQGRGLSWQGSPPFAAAISGRDAGNGLAIEAQLDADKGTLHMNGRLPIDLGVSDPALSLNKQGALALQTRFEKLSLGSLLAFVPGVARVSGTLDGKVAISGTLGAPTAKGSVQFDDVSLTLPRLGQRFSHAYVKAQLDGHSLRLEQGKVRDLDGTATLAAQLTFNSIDDWSAALNANARNFPLRKSGVMLGRFDADTKITAHTTREQSDVLVRLSNVSVSLTTENLANVQALEPHAEIVFSDAAPEAKSAEPSAHASGGRAKISIVSSEALWIRRDDFAVQMQPDLQIVLGGETPELSGRVKLLRGFISLLGQSFDIKSGQVTFAGGTAVDPRLEITALHSGHTGHRVRLEVTGFVRKPELAFYVDDQLVTAGDAVIALSGRGGDTSGNSSDSAQKQLASAAIGMTTGLLSLGARREFGGFIPMLAIEQGEQTRVRVGLEADRLIPKFLRGFVRGAYVEGILSSEDASGRSGGSATGSRSNNTASGGGVLLELMLPSDMVWAGQYGPGLCWSVDLAFRP